MSNILALISEKRTPFLTIGSKFINFVSKKLAVMRADMLLTTACSTRTISRNSGKAFTEEKLQIFLQSRIIAISVLQDLHRSISTIYGCNQISLI